MVNPFKTLVLKSNSTKLIFDIFIFPRSHGIPAVTFSLNVPVSCTRMPTFVEMSPCAFPCYILEARIHDLLFFFFYLPSQGQIREASRFHGHAVSVVKKWRTASWPQRANDPDCFLRRMVTSQRRSFVQTDATQQQPGSPRSGLFSHLKWFSLSTLEEHGFICSYPSSARGGPHLLCCLGS